VCGTKPQTVLSCNPNIGPSIPGQPCCLHYERAQQINILYRNAIEAMSTPARTPVSLSTCSSASSPRTDDDFLSVEDAEVANVLDFISGM
jgi:hypothetical protein